MNQKIVDEISRLIDKVHLKEEESGFELNTLRQGVGHYVAEQIVKTSDVKLLNLSPDWVKRQVLEYVRLYQEEGEVAIYSSAGKADHTKMVKSLSNLLCPK
jgi:hypothetical protein